MELRKLIENTYVGGDEYSAYIAYVQLAMTILIHFPDTHFPRENLYISEKQKC